MLALQQATGVRPCTVRIPAKSPSATPCALAELERCAAPCAGKQTEEEYAPALRAVDALVAGLDTDPLRLAAVSERRAALIAIATPAAAICTNRDSRTARRRSALWGQRPSPRVGLISS